MNIAPQNIENLLKGDPFISQVMVTAIGGPTRWP
jgi:long-subunit acyl-CoA synthetase (AMP-forming)